MIILLLFAIICTILPSTYAQAVFFSSPKYGMYYPMNVPVEVYIPYSHETFSGTVTQKCCELSTSQMV
jgi:hypothetical protein